MSQPGDTEPGPRQLWAAPLWDGGMGGCVASCPSFILPCPCPLSLFLLQQQAKEESLIGWLQKQLSDYSTPPVMSYMQTVMAVADLEKSIKAWERRVAIAEVREMGPGAGWVLSPAALLQAVLEALPVGCSLPPEQRLNFNN